MVWPWLVSSCGFEEYIPMYSPCTRDAVEGGCAIEASQSTKHAEHGSRICHCAVQMVYVSVSMQPCYCRLAYMVQLDNC